MQDEDSLLFWRQSSRVTIIYWVFLNIVKIAWGHFLISPLLFGGFGGPLMESRRTKAGSFFRGHLIKMSNFFF